MHLLVKLIARPGLEETVITTISRAFDVRSAGSMAKRRALVCQRVGDPSQVLYVTTAAESVSMEEHFAAVQPGLESLLAKPALNHRCRAIASFRRWSVDPSVIVCGVVRVKPDQSQAVMRRILDNGEAYKVQYPGLVAYELLVDLQDEGFIVLLHEWKTIEDLEALRASTGKGLAGWVHSDLGGGYNRYEYRLRASTAISDSAAGVGAGS